MQQVLGRDERLRVDFERMQVLRSRSQFIDFVPAGNPPDRYTIYFTCTGLMLDNGNLVTHDKHQVLIYLHLQYPTQKPQITWVTPIFHPNIRGRSVCLGRSWSPALKMDDLCVELGSMIQYKVFNVDDPLDPNAAQLIRGILEKEPEKFPIDRRNLFGQAVDIDLKEMP